MNESELQRVYNYRTYPRHSKIQSDERFVNIEDGSLNRTPWVCFIIKDNKPSYYVSFGGTPDKFLLNQLPKPKIYPNYKIQDIISNLCGSYCL